MITSILSAILLGLSAAIISVAMIVVMPHEMILNWWFVFGQAVGMRKVNGRQVERWFFRPVWGCEKCFAGQIVLWSYLITHTTIRRGDPFGLCCGCWWIYPSNDYSLFCHILAICSGVIMAVILSKFIQSLIN
jgi:hypothetical protein